MKSAAKLQALLLLLAINWPLVSSANKHHQEDQSNISNEILHLDAATGSSEQQLLGPGAPQAEPKAVDQLRDQITRLVIQQRMAEKDHLMMEKWLVDNIKDLHRELKQTELDFEHYVEVTKNILAENEAQLKRQLAVATSLPLTVPIEAPATGGPMAPHSLGQLLILAARPPAAAPTTYSRRLASYTSS